jgi:DNA-binding transcriptional MerR regulator
MTDQLLTAKAVCQLLKISQRTLAAWTAVQIVPSVVIGNRSRRYRESDIRRVVEGGPN